MPSILLPRRALAQPRHIMPSSGGLAEGLVDAWVGSTPDVIRSQGNIAPLTRSAPLTAGSGQYGQSAVFDGSAAILSRAAAPLAGAGECTLLTIVIPRATASATRSIFGYGSGASNTPILFVGQGLADQVQFWARSDGGASQQMQVAGGSGWVNGTPAVLVGTRSEARNYHRLYLNGNLLSGAAATSIGAITLNRTAVGGLQRSSAGLFTNCDVFLCLTWNRALSDAEVKSVSENPWQVFAGSPRILISSAINDTALSGSSSSIVTSTGALVTHVALSSSAAAVASATGGITTFKPLSGYASCLFSVSGGLSTEIIFVGSASSVSLSTSSLQTAIPLQGVAQAQASASAAFAANAVNLSGSAYTTASAAGALSTAIAVAGNAVIASTAAGGLTTAIALGASSATIISLEGALATEIRLFGSVAVESSATASILPAGVALSASAACAASASGAMMTSIVLAGSSLVMAQASGSLAMTDEMPDAPGDRTFVFSPVDRDFVILPGAGTVFSENWH